MFNFINDKNVKYVISISALVEMTQNPRKNFKMALF